jgi:LemA protein
MSGSYNDFFRGKFLKWGIIAILAIIIISTSISTWNGLNAADQAVRSSWGQVQNVMQRRADVILNEVEVVNGYAKHEEKVFEDIAAARAVLYNSNADINSKLEADEAMKTYGKNILAIAENYPDLKASELFSNLQEQIEGSENRVSVERRNFIKAVENYNIKVTRFPGNIFARLMGFEPKDYFEADPEAQKAPKVEFD